MQQSLEGISVANAGEYALRFVSGSHPGGEVPLGQEREVTIGRSGGLDVVIGDDRVSRRHARLWLRGGEVLLQDAGSTNGTFVNGEKVDRAQLKRGDRIHIGGNVLELVRVTRARAAALSLAEVRPALPPLEGPDHPTAPGHVMAGSLEQVALPDLLQLLASARKSGVLRLEGPQQGRIHLRRGQIRHAALDNRPDVTGRKALLRMLVWTRGDFALDPADDATFLDEIEEPNEQLLIEAMRQHDEIVALARRLPKPDDQLEVCRQLDTPLSSLTLTQLDLLQLVHNHGIVGRVVDKSPSTDLETYQDLLALLERGVIGVARAGLL